MAPYALGDVGSTADQGYPCATLPPGQTDTTGSCTTTTTTTSTTTTVATTTTPVTTTTLGGVAGSAATPPSVLGASKTVQSPKAAAVLPATHTSGTLPFTGMQLGTFVVLGLLLIAGGLVLRASGRNRRPTA